MAARAHPFWQLDPVDIILAEYQRNEAVDQALRSWLATAATRTMADFVMQCPRVDWILWMLQSCAELEKLDLGLVVRAGRVVRAEAVKSFRRGAATAGLEALRTFLFAELR